MSGASGNYGYVAGDGGRPKRLCTWPDCDYFASTEIRVRGVWHALCLTHRREFMRNPLQPVKWQAERRQKQTSATDRI